MGLPVPLAVKQLLTCFSLLPCLVPTSFHQASWNCIPFKKWYPKNLCPDSAPWKLELRLFGKSQCYGKTWTGSLTEEPSGTWRSWSLRFYFYTSGLRGESSPKVGAPNKGKGCKIHLSASISATFLHAQQAGKQGGVSLGSECLAAWEVKGVFCSFC